MNSGNASTSKDFRYSRLFVRQEFLYALVPGFIIENKLCIQKLCPTKWMYRNEILRRDLSRVFSSRKYNFKIII